DFKELLAASAKAGCEEAVHQIARQFLETGVAPIQVVSSKKSETHVQVSKNWPLPLLEYLVPMLQSDRRHRPAPGPHYGVLIDMAIADKHPDEVLRWYDKMCAERQPAPYGDPLGAYADAVAAAVVQSHPQRSLEI